MSLFRNPDYRVRLQAAISQRDQLQKVLDTLVSRYAEISSTASDVERLTIAGRILATGNALNAWSDYINDGCPLEPRAQVSLNTYSHLQAVGQGVDV